MPGRRKTSLIECPLFDLVRPPGRLPLVLCEYRGTAIAAVGGEHGQARDGGQSGRRT
jgi:hypothetical protein